MILPKNIFHTGWKTTIHRYINKKGETVEQMVSITTDALLIHEYNLKTGKIVNKTIKLV